jgi:hypothetical protein
MKKIEPYPIAISLFFVLTILYVVCIGVKLILLLFGVEGIWHMHQIWQTILPGFTEINSLSIIIGLLEVSVGAYAIAYIVIPIYNYFLSRKTKDQQVERIPIVVRFRTLFLTLLTYFFALFTLCILYDLVISDELSMAFLWEMVLPGFKDLSFSSYLIGVFDILVYSAYVSFIFSITLNYFEKTQNKDEVIA